VANLGYICQAERLESRVFREPKRQEKKMSFETVSLLLNWMEMGALLAILFRLSSTFELIASTQRELRRAIHHLGERRAAEPGINDAFGGREITSGSYSPRRRTEIASTIELSGLAHPSP
jgi:hypothetical protein